MKAWGGLSLFQVLRRDAARYRDWGRWWQHMGFWVVAVFRLGVRARGIRLPGLRHLALVAAWFVKQPFRVLLHVELPTRAHVGPGLALFHPYNVLVGAEVEIGEDCSLYHEVTLGAGAGPGMPRLGHHVVLFAGARAFGDITIGDRTEVGSNCVVSRSLPADVLVVAAPTRVIPQSLLRKAPTAATGAPPAGPAAPP
jgi:serine O-acetyltransferase